MSRREYDALRVNYYMKKEKDVQNRQRPVNGSSYTSTLNRIKLVKITVPRHEQETSPLPPISTEENVPDSVQPSTYQKPLWRLLLSSPTFKGILGFVIGVGCLFALSRFVNISEILQLLRRNLTTSHGVFFALLASVAFVLAFICRAIRWKLFLNPVRNVKTTTVVQLFLVGVFLNFLLPIRAGELAKSLILKRTHSLAISQSLPTITMDKAMDLLPAFFILPIVPLLGIQLDGRFWYILGVANAGLLSLVLFIALAAWRRHVALNLLHKITNVLPTSIGSKIAIFVIGFVDALLMSARSPTTLLRAVLLTGLSVSFDGLYNFFAFWTVGTPITFGQAVFGYLLYNLFYILPNPPGQVGSNEVVGLLIFTGLFHIPPTSVTAMIVFFHAWSGLLMGIMGMTSLSALGITFSSTLKISPEEQNL